MKLSVETFIAVVRKSGLVDNERLHSAVIKFSPSGENYASAAGLADALIAENLLTKWQVDKLLQGKHRGYFLGKYKLLSLLGKGGMSSVYLAEHRLMRRQCALKVLPAKRVDDSSYLERFHREAQAAALLDHPNIVRAYDVDHQEDGDRQIHFLVMEYVEGSDLQSLVPEKGLVSVLDAAEYARQAAAGLQHAHENGMVHRDIKPGNVLVDLHGVVKILDLGLARFFTVDDGTEALTLRHDERVLGTADYLAPEQALDSHSVDYRADLYSLGCTLYFMVTGQPPFTEGTLAQRLLAHQLKTPTAVESLRVDLPLSLASIIRKMMEKNPDDRYATAADLEKALFKWVDENADRNWRKAHFNVYGSRSSDPDMALFVPLAAKPIDRVATIPIAPIPSVPSHVSLSDSRREPQLPSPKSHATATAESSETNDASLNLFLSTLTQPKIEPAPAKPVTNVLPGTSAQTVPEKTHADPPMKTMPSPSSLPDFEARDLFKIKTTNQTTPILTPAVETISTKRQNNTSKKNGMPVSVRGGIGAAVTFGLLGIYLFGGFSFLNKSEENKRPILTLFPPDKHEVTVGGRGAEYKSIREALIAVRNRYRPGSQSSNSITIKVAAGTYPDRIRIDGRSQSWPEGIKLLGIGEVRLAPPGDDPVLRLANISRFTIENIRIDASDKKVAVELADDLHESRLSQTVISGFSEVGILCKGAQGLSFSNGQLLLDLIKFEPAVPQATGIRLETGSEHDVNNIIIRSCRFLHPMAAGIAIQGRSPYGIEINQCIFNEMVDGIRFEGEQQLKLIRVANNSFRKTKMGIVFTKLPNELSAELVFRRNLFMETAAAEAVVKPIFDEGKFRSMISSSPIGIQDNWSDRGKPSAPLEGEITIFFENQGKQGEKNLSLSSTDPKEEKFLMPTDKSPHKDIGGAQGSDSKWIGAVGP